MSNSDLPAGKNADSSLKSAIVLSQISLVLMMAVSVIGLFVPDMYTKGTTWARATFLGNDLVNLCIYTPLILLSGRRQIGISRHFKSPRTP